MCRCYREGPSCIFLIFSTRRPRHPQRRGSRLGGELRVIVFCSDLTPLLVLGVKRYANVMNERGSDAASRRRRLHPAHLPGQPRGHLATGYLQFFPLCSPVIYVVFSFFFSSLLSANLWQGQAAACDAASLGVSPHRRHEAVVPRGTGGRPWLVVLPREPLTRHAVRKRCPSAAPPPSSHKPGSIQALVPPS